MRSGDKVCWLVGLAGLILWAPPVQAQIPAGVRGEPGRFEVIGLDWPRLSAWRLQAQLVRETRWSLLRTGNTGALNARPSLVPAAPDRAGAVGALTVVTGTFYLPVIPISFSGVDTMPFPISDYQSVFFSSPSPAGRPYTVKSFYEELSHGLIRLLGQVFDPARTDSTAAYYENGCNGIGVVTPCPDGGRRFGLMLLAALDSVNARPGADTLWGQFDNDGLDGRANSGDDDGDVDFVTFLQPKRDGACQPSTGIWAHRYVIAAWNSGSKYVTKTPRRNAAGEPIPGEFVKVNNYTMQSAVGGSDGCTRPNEIMPIGTVAHETGHAFGLPDLYDTDRQSGTEGIGEWGLMGSGNYTQQYSPSGFEAWSLNELGWVMVDTLGASRVVTTGARQTSDTVFLARTADPTQFLLVENRQAVESDTALLNPTQPDCGGGRRSRCRKDPGLLLWHIDLLRIQSGRLANRINAGPLQGVALVQADGLNNLRSSGAGRNRGDRGDSYPGSTDNIRYTLLSAPAARTNNAEYTGFIIDQIQPLANGVMRFRFLRRQPSLIRSAYQGASVRVNGELWGRYEEVIPQGDQFSISADTLQEVANGLTRVRFLSWSNGGPRTQTLTSGANPDTVTSTFNAEHRLIVSATGGAPGTVTANRPGDLGVGFHLAEGTAVTLTATPSTGATFAGWRGDTTAASLTLNLAMGKPYTLSASFIPTVEISVQDATTEILGTPKLSADQKIYLDELGNRNGLYDVGDFLALLQRNGQAVGPNLQAGLQPRAARQRGN